MRKIEKFLKGNMDLFSQINFKRKMKEDKIFRNKVILYKNIDIVMRGALLVAEAEIDLAGKNIDKLAAAYVSDYYNNNENHDDYKEFISWS